MAEEDSFVILGTSPLPSLCSDGKSLLNDALDSIEPKTPTEKEPEANLTTPFASLTAVDNTPEQENASTNGGSLPTTLPSEQNSLAASFILGDINAEVLKVNTEFFTCPGPFIISILSLQNSVYSQFPSLCSMQACAEDVVKLQTMMTEYMVLKRM